MEHRRASRSRVLKSAKIIFNRASSVIDCTVRNRSSTGAALLVEGVLGIPDEFVLAIEGEQFRRSCRVVWRQGTRIGVAFLDEPH